MALAKAFLSHSSSDKLFVEAVAKRLGRQQVQFDKWAFTVGQQFVSAITASLNASSTFVLFASKASLASFWVKFETSQAHTLIRSEIIKSALIFIIDPTVTHYDLPKWMQRGLIRQTGSAAAAARAIQHHLNSIRGLEQNELFLGRNALLEEFSTKLLPTEGGKPPHILVVSGLEGVGRRTFLSHAIRNNLSIQLGPVFHLRRTDGVDALHINLISELNDANSVEELAKEIAKFRRKDAAGKADLLAALLGRIGNENVVPCIVDDGALLESSSHYRPEAIALFESLKGYPDTVVALIHTHRPRMSDDEFRTFDACYEKIPALDSLSTKQLLAKRLQLAKIEFVQDDIETLSPYLAGYPPSISLAVGFIKNYGLPVMLADKSTLVDFQIQTFADVLNKLDLTAEEWGILRLLAAGLEMPIDALASALGTKAEQLAPNLRRLVDLNLVLASGLSFTIAYPIRFAVQASKGTLSAEDFTRIGKSLKEMYWDGQDSLPSYDVIESTITALLRSDDPDLKPFAGLVVPSLLFRAAKDSYEQWGHANWEKALTLLRRLLSLDPHHRGGLVLLLKIQVKMGLWAEAEKTLKQIQAQKMPDRFALEGYFFWKQGKFAKAINLYKVALANRERAVEIYHGLASCLFQLGDIQEAKKYIREGLANRARFNGLLLDLAAKMAIVARDFDEATEYVEQLRRLNQMTDYHHRAATLFAAMRQPSKALPHAREALNGSRGRYEIDSVLISVLIDLKEFQEAQERLQELEKKDKAGGNRKDVRLGLRVKLLIRQGDWRAAEAFWESLSEKKSPVQKALRLELLERKTADPTLSRSERESSAEEFRMLSEDLNGAGDALTMLDDYESESELTSTEG
jgi:tetratricopeptide (TPR) repeat protein